MAVENGSGLSQLVFFLSAFLPVRLRPPPPFGEHAGCLGGVCVTNGAVNKTNGA